MIRRFCRLFQGNATLPTELVPTPIAISTGQATNNIGPVVEFLRRIIGGLLGINFGGQALGGLERRRECIRIGLRAV